MGNTWGVINKMSMIAGVAGALIIIAQILYGVFTSDWHQDSNIAIVTLAIISFLLIIISIFLIYRNMQLENEMKLNRFEKEKLEE